MKNFNSEKFEIRKTDFNNVGFNTKIEVSDRYVANNIDLNINNIINNVKKQRMDIIKLNNEIKNSRNDTEMRNKEDNNNRNDLMTIIRKLTKEKEFLEMEIENLEKTNKITEMKSREKDTIINDLRIKITDYQKNFNLKNTETEKVKFNYSRLSIKLEDILIEKKKKYPSVKVLETLEKQIENYTQKYKNENRKNFELKNEIMNLKENFDIILKDNNKFQHILNEQKEKKKHDNINEDMKLKTELIYDYHLMNSFKKNLTDAIVDLNNKK